MPLNESRPLYSLRALHEASDELMRSLPDDDATVSKNDTEKFLARIQSFVDRIVETGTVLDKPADRNNAQGLIDFWIATSSELTHGQGINRPRPTQAEILLKPFARVQVDSAIKGGGAILKKLTKKRKLLLRRLLFALLRFPESGDMFDSAPASRHELQTFGDPKQVSMLLDQLGTADILEFFNRDGTQMVALKYLALVRQWPWLREQIDERMGFRHQAAKWQEKGKNGGELLKRAQREMIWSYGNLNEYEQKFVKDSDKSALRVKVLAALSACILVGVLSLSTWVYNEFIFPKRVDESEKQVTSSATSSQSKADAIIWLANKRRSLNFPSVTLSELNLQKLRVDFPNFANATLSFINLQGASLRGASFRFAKLGGVSFEDANLKSAGFDGATIKSAAYKEQTSPEAAKPKQTSFRGASLVRATFDEAIFCGEVDFSDADVRDASFRNVSMERAKLNFEGTAWWLLKDLNLRLGETLERDAPPGFSKLVPPLKKELLAFENKYRGASLSELDKQKLKAILWNDSAWMLSIYGIYGPITGDDELSFLADKENRIDGIELARKSIALIKELDPSDKERSANFSDTLAYLLLQRAAHEQKSDIKSQDLDEALRLWETSIKLRPVGSSRFRYAVALSAAGNEPEAEQNLAQAILENYYPTHETYLLKAAISPSLWATVQGALQGLQQAASKSNGPEPTAPKSNNTESCAPMNN